MDYEKEYADGKHYAIATRTRKGHLRRVPDTKFPTERHAREYGNKYHSGRDGAKYYEVVPHPDNKVNEMTEIQELSRNTVHAYATKANSYDRKNVKKTHTGFWKALKDLKKLPKTHHKTPIQRLSLVNLANKKLRGKARIGVQEETEIQELSKRVLASYVGKASKDASVHSFDAGINMNKDTKILLKKNNIAQKRLKGISKAANKLGEEKMDNRYADDDYKDKQRKKNAANMIRNARKNKQAKRDEYMDKVDEADKPWDDDDVNNTQGRYVKSKSHQKEDDIGKTLRSHYGTPAEKKK